MFRNILMLSAYPLICTDFQNMRVIISNKTHKWGDNNLVLQELHKEPGVSSVPASIQSGSGRRRRLFPFPLFTVMQFVNSECATNTGDQGKVHFSSGIIQDFI